LNDAERQAFIAHEDDGQADENVLRELRAKRLLDRTGNGGEVAVGELWQAFVRHQHMAQPDARRGVTVDVDSGEVYVDGHTIEPLTELEYKLLLLLYGRLNKVVDKYTIVTNVWGETYLDSVDDARIEKLVSRLRNKLEPGAAEPRYLTTLRGRGYRLVG
jgi:DNA-binding response OmpR family regulator